jgi:hypothetical protein
MTPADALSAVEVESVACPFCAASGTGGARVEREAGSEGGKLPVVLLGGRGEGEGGRGRGGGAGEGGGGGRGCMSEVVVMGTGKGSPIGPLLSAGAASKILCRYTEVGEGGPYSGQVSHRHILP